MEVIEMDTDGIENTTFNTTVELYHGMGIEWIRHEAMIWKLGLENAEALERHYASHADDHEIAMWDYKGETKH